MGNTTKLRKLDLDELPHSCRSDQFIKIKKVLVKSIQFSFMFATFSAIIVNPNLLYNFLKSYRQQYYLVVRGNANYCTENLDYKKLSLILKDKIISQNNALSEFENSLKMHTNFTSIAIFGTTGVGKSLLISLLRESFQWEDNVHHFLWSPVLKNHENLINLYQILGKLSSCGQNVILVDNLEPKSRDIVIDFNKYSQIYLSSLSKQFGVLLIYSFNILRYNDELNSKYDYYVHYLRNMKGIKTIQLRNLEKQDVEKCINVEIRTYNITLSKNQIAEILKPIDFFSSGCKSVSFHVAKFVQLIKNENKVL